LPCNLQNSGFSAEEIKAMAASNHKDARWMIPDKAQVIRATDTKTTLVVCPVQIMRQVGHG
jgi:hypothetical protein